MKIELIREPLLDSLHHVIGAVERRQTMPALSHVLLSFNAGLMTITGTDLEIELVSQQSVEYDGQTDISVPARKLFDIIKNLPEGAPIKMEDQSGRFILSSGRSRFTLATLPANEFPALESIDFSHEFSLPKSKLLYVIGKTSFAMAQQDVRYYLNGLLLETSGTILRAIATDGHRLSLSEVTIETPLPDEKQVIVPRKGVLELQKLLAEGDDQVTVSLSENHIRVMIDGLRFTSKLIDGRFPDYQRVMPADSDKMVALDKSTFRQSLTRASILSNEKYRGVRLTVGNQVLGIQTQNPDQEEAEEELEIAYEGESVEIGFNVNYILDVLNAIDGEEVQLALKDANSSCLISESGEERNRYVIMPMRL